MENSSTERTATREDGDSAQATSRLDRRIQNFCTDCMSSCVGERNLDKYAKVPWKKSDNITGCVKTNELLKIRGYVTIRDVRRAINRMKNGRSERSTSGSMEDLQR